MRCSWVTDNPIADGSGWWSVATMVGGCGGCGMGGCGCGGWGGWMWGFLSFSFFFPLTIVCDCGGSGWWR